MDGHRGPQRERGHPPRPRLSLCSEPLLYPFFDELSSIMFPEILIIDWTQPEYIHRLALLQGTWIILYLNNMPCSDLFKQIFIASWVRNSGSDSIYIILTLGYFRMWGANHPSNPPPLKKHTQNTKRLRLIIGNILIKTTVKIIGFW